jgi:hypothetical protein
MMRISACVREFKAMDLSALIKAVLAPMETQSSGDAMRDLKPGDQLTGRVLSIEADGRALVDLGRTRVLAQMTFAVKAGDPLKLHVVENGAVLHLQAERPQPPVARIPVPLTDFFRVLTPDQQEQLLQITEHIKAPSGSSQSSAALPRELLHAVARIGSLFESAPLDQPVEKLAAWIKSAVEDRGVFFEKHLADLVSRQPESGSGRAEASKVLMARDIKPQLMIVKQFLDSIPDSQETVSRLNARETGLLRNCVEKLLNHVSQQQAHAVTRWESGTPQQVMVHLWPLHELRKPVELKIYYPPKKHGGGDHRQHRIAILLDLNRLGPLRVDLSLVADNLHIGFFVASEALKDYFQRELPWVEAALSGKFQQLRLDVLVSREKIERFHHEDLNATTTGGIDISV